MTDKQEKTAELKSAADQAWKIYEAVDRAMPDCEHTRACKETLASAEEEHRKALAAYIHLACGIDY